jgi:hypothetical protein
MSRESGPETYAEIHHSLNNQAGLPVLGTRHGYMDWPIDVKSPTGAAVVPSGKIHIPARPVSALGLVVAFELHIRSVLDSSNTGLGLHDSLTSSSFSFTLSNRHASSPT